MSFIDLLFGPPNVEKLKAKGDVKGLMKASQYKKESSVRNNAIKALGKIGDKRAVISLIEALKDSDLEVRKNAALVLDEIGWESDKSESSAAYWAVKNQWEECIKIGTPAVIPLIAELKDGNSEVRENSAEALVRIGTSAMEPLVAMLKDRRWEVVCTAASALEKIDWKPDESESGAAYWAVKRQWNECVKIGTPAIMPLIAALRDVDVREDAAKALVRIGTPAVEPLIVTLKDRYSYVRTYAAIALGEIGDKRAVEPLTAIALTDEFYDVRKVANRALENMGFYRYEDDRLKPF
jgi:HEAT repeat protein